MSGNAPRAPFEAFFLPAAGGERFCIFHPASGAPLGSILYVHPFAEEMNKSRRMAALQARAFCARGYNVLQIDLLGCGDSSGDFGDARWHAWHEDVALATDWLARHTEGPVHLWGLRLGALLALDHSRQAGRSFAGLLLWQPVISGAQFMTQFLRLRMGSEMLSGVAPPAARGSSGRSWPPDERSKSRGTSSRRSLPRRSSGSTLRPFRPSTRRRVGSKSTPKASRLPVCGAPRKPVSQRAPKSSCTRSGASRSGARWSCANAPSSSPPRPTPWR